MTAPKKAANAALTEAEFLKLASDNIAEAAVDGPVPVDPDLADYMGVFVEEALSEEDAVDSLFEEEESDDD